MLDKIDATHDKDDIREYASMLDELERKPAECDHSNYNLMYAESFCQWRY